MRKHKGPLLYKGKSYFDLGHINDSSLCSSVSSMQCAEAKNRFFLLNIDLAL